MIVVGESATRTYYHFMLNNKPLSFSLPIRDVSELSLPDDENGQEAIEGVFNKQLQTSGLRHSIQCTCLIFVRTVQY